ncbi:MAG: Clp1/GlmU family protein [Candidatus Methanomethylicia archaeon]
MLNLQDVEVKRGSSLIVKGPARFSVLDGLVEVFGAPVSSGESFIAIADRYYPVEVIDNSIIEVSGGENSLCETVSVPLIPQDWKNAVDKILRFKNPVIIVLGDVDSGKSGFTLYLANRFCLSGIRVAIVDSDIGQSDIGPPTTIGLSVIDKPSTSYAGLPLTDAYFVGDNTPVGHLLPMVVGTMRMVDRGFKYGANAVIVNTTGMVYGGVAQALKYFKIEALNPNFIVALQRNSEIEHLLKPFEGVIEILRLKTPQHIPRKSRSERTDYREFKLGQYFIGARTVTLKLSNIILLNTSIGYGNENTEIRNIIEKIISIKPLSVKTYGKTIVMLIKSFLRPDMHEKLYSYLKEKYDELKIVSLQKIRGLVLGLYDLSNRFLSLGILEDISSEDIKVKSPVKSPLEVKYVRFGSIIVNEHGDEIARIKPGLI